MGNNYYSLHKCHILGHIMLFALNCWCDLTNEDALPVLPQYNSPHQNPQYSQIQ